MASFRELAGTRQPDGLMTNGAFRPVGDSACSSVGTSPMHRAALLLHERADAFLLLRAMKLAAT